MNIDIDISILNAKEFKEYKLVDIREPNEYTNLPANTTELRHIPFAQFPQNMNQFKPNEKYLIFCAMGGRSHHMAELLNQKGITALSINFGINAVNQYLNKIKNAGN